MAKYICFEGTEGVGKTTQTQKLVDYLRAKGFKVLQTKEPGSSHAPLTMELRNVMLNAKYDAELTTTSRELISQAIRSIHLEKVIVPALSQYDFIVQDRGILSGLSYGVACGNELKWLQDMADKITLETIDVPYDMVYDDIIYLTGNVSVGLHNAQNSKQEFEAGDAIENKGISFMEQVAANMTDYASDFNTTIICIDGKTIEQVFEDILNQLELK